MTAFNKFLLYIDRLQVDFYHILAAFNKTSTIYWPPSTRLPPYIDRLQQDFYHILTAFNKISTIYWPHSTKFLPYIDRLQRVGNYVRHCKWQLKKIKLFQLLINKYLIEETGLNVSSQQFITIVIVWILNIHFLNSNIHFSSINKLLTITNVLKTIFVISSDLISLHICRWPCVTNPTSFTLLFSGRKIDFISILFWGWFHLIQWI